MNQRLLGQPWLSRDLDHSADEAGSVLRAWRVAAGRTQVDTAAALGLTQQHLSQMEKGQRPISLEQRRLMVNELGIAPEELGLTTSRSYRSVVLGEHDVRASRVRWRSERRWLDRHRWELARLAAQLSPAGHRVHRTSLIAAPAWQLPEPISLRSMVVTLDEGRQTTAVTGREPESELVRPLRAPRTRFDRYTSAIKHLSPPALFESRPSYRLLDVSLGARQLGFGLAAYFDKLDVSEAVGHELAAECMDVGVPRSPAELVGRLPFRDLIGDPFDPARRAVIPAISTLTVRLRRYPAPPTFLLHWRDSTRVATAGGIYDVIPAGEFQPSSVALWDRRADLDLWRNIVREYAEEVLGEPEHDGSRSQPIDYDAWPLYQRLEDAQDDGAVAPFLLGLGLDALTLAAAILTVVVIDDDVFSEVFGDAVRFNDEGEVVTVGGGSPAGGVPFTRDAVSRMLSSEPMASPGAACLSLAWQHRRFLGL